MKNSLWRNQSFMIILLSSTAIVFSQQLYAIAMPLILYQMTHTSIAMSFVRAVEFLPNILLAFFIGFFVDHYGLRYMLKLSQLGQCIVLILLFLLLQIKIGLFLIYPLVFILMTLNLIFNNARTVSIKASVPTDIIIHANAKLQTITQILQISGPMLAGLLLMLHNINLSLLYASAIIFLSYTYAKKIPINAVSASKISMKPMIKSIRETWNNLKENRLLWSMSWTAMIFNISDGISNIIYIYYGKFSLGLSNFQIGVLFAIMGLGSVLGSLVIAKIRKRLGDVRLIWACIVTSGLLYFLIFLYPITPFIMAMIFFQGFVSMIIALCIWTIRQESTPIEVLGKVTGLTSTIFKLGLPFAIAFAGIFAYYFNAIYLFLICAFINGTLAIAYMLLVPMQIQIDLTSKN